MERLGYGVSRPNGTDWQWGGRGFLQEEERRVEPNRILAEDRPIASWCSVEVLPVRPVLIPRVWASDRG
jgi:hypothetical protein